MTESAHLDVDLVAGKISADVGGLSDHCLAALHTLYYSASRPGYLGPGNHTSCWTNDGAHGTAYPVIQRKQPLLPKTRAPTERKHAQRTLFTDHSREALTLRIWSTNDCLLGTLT